MAPEIKNIVTSPGLGCFESCMRKPFQCRESGFQAAYTRGPKGRCDKKGKPMEQTFIERMDKSLTDLKTEIVSNLMANNEDFKEIVEGMDPKDLADIASDDIDRKMIEAIGSQELKRLKLIDSALTRIQQGKYGLCIKCGKRIPQDRLEAIPYALMCIECKTAEERRNR
jgi:RNA polymerase-binding protein DksA